jgi:hypothetical protein
VLGRLAEALDLSNSQLVGGPRSEPVLHIPHDKQPSFVEEETGFERRSLSPLYRARGIDFVLNRLPPRARTGPFPSHRQSVERWLIGHAGELAAARIDIAGLRDRAQRLLPAISMAGANVLSAWLDGPDAGEA